MAGDGSFDPISPSLQAISSERPQNPLRLNSDEHLQVTGAPPPPLRSAYLPALPLTSGAGPTSRCRIHHGHTLQPAAAPSEIDESRLASFRRDARRERRSIDNEVDREGKCG
ncbi:hypothetical protein LINPERPRIM_LOCUS18155 [Linum perenne]